MDKEKILEKSREENKKSNRDEGVEYVEKKAMKLGYKLFIILAIMFSLINRVQGRDNSVILALLWGFFMAKAYSEYKFSKSKDALIGLAIYTLLFLNNVIEYLNIVF